jgi:hypothetical protein
MDIQSLANYSKIIMGDKQSEKFMNKRHKDLASMTPHSYYLENPSTDSYQLIISLIHQWCSTFN